MKKYVVTISLGWYRDVREIFAEDRASATSEARQIAKRLRGRHEAKHKISVKIAK